MEQPIAIPFCSWCQLVVPCWVELCRIVRRLVLKLIHASVIGFGPLDAGFANKLVWHLGCGCAWRCCISNTDETKSGMGCSKITNGCDGQKCHTLFKMLQSCNYKEYYCHIENLEKAWLFEIIVKEELDIIPKQGGFYIESASCYGFFIMRSQSFSLPFVTSCLLIKDSNLHRYFSALRQCLLLKELYQ